MRNTKHAYIVVLFTMSDNNRNVFCYFNFIRAKNMDHPIISSFFNDDTKEMNKINKKKKLMIL